MSDFFSPGGKKPGSIEDEMDQIVSAQIDRMLKDIGQDKQERLFKHLSYMIGKHTIKKMVDKKVDMQEDLTGGIIAVQLMIKTLLDRVVKLDPSYSLAQYQRDIVKMAMRAALMDGINPFEKDSDDKEKGNE